MQVRKRWRSTMLLNSKKIWHRNRCVKVLAPVLSNQNGEDTGIADREPSARRKLLSGFRPQYQYLNFGDLEDAPSGRWRECWITVSANETL